MARPPALSPQEKTALILEVLAGRLTLARAAERAGVSAQAVSNWRRQFVQAGTSGLMPPRDQVRPSLAEARLRQMAREIQRLKVALADAHLALTGHRPEPRRSLDDHGTALPWTHAAAGRSHRDGS